MSTRAERSVTIERLEKDFAAARGIYLTDFNRVNVAKITKLRRDLRSKGGKYLVVKNSLAAVALERCGKKELVPYLQGAVGVALGREDAVAPARVIKDFRKENKELLGIRVAYVEGTLYTAAQTEILADLPTREVLLSQLLSCLKAPMSNLVGSLSGILTKLVGTLEAVKNKKESAAG
jgi:large subunit ribosomal protein L10